MTSTELRPVRASRQVASHDPGILVVDIGGTSVKLFSSDQRTPREFASGPNMTPNDTMSEIRQIIADWDYDVVSVGYPGVVVNGQPAVEPHNLGSGWVGFDFSEAFGRPARVINDAALQALGSYRSGRMLYLGFGTGLGSAMVIDGALAPMELAHLPYMKGSTYEDYVGARGLERLGQKRWHRHVENVIALLQRALQADDIVIGGGNAVRLKQLPPDARRVENESAFMGGIRLWNERQLSNDHRASAQRTVLVEVHPTADALMHAAAERFVRSAINALSVSGRFAVAISGGATPEGMYALLASDPYRTRVDWNRVHVFWTDERCVPPDDPQSNYRMARLSLLDHVPIPAANVHRIHGEGDPAEAAAAYERELRTAFATPVGAPRLEHGSRFDFVLLGMGTDGHTASLFPGTSAVREQVRWVVAERGPTSMWRITLAPPVINAAAEVVFIVAGVAKAAMLHRVIDGPIEPVTLPAQAVAPRDGRVHWLVDADAANDLRNDSRDYNPHMVPTESAERQ